jgi:hypothetical protein
VYVLGPYCAVCHAALMDDMPVSQSVRSCFDAFVAHFPFTLQPSTGKRVWPDPVLNSLHSLLQIEAQVLETVPQSSLAKARQLKELLGETKTLEQLAEEQAPRGAIA